MYWKRASKAGFAAIALTVTVLCIGSCSIFRKSRTSSPEKSPSGYTYSYDPSWGRGGGIATARETPERTNPYRTKKDETDSTSTRRSASPSETEELLSYARSFLGTPYRYGTSGPSSFDCSGFTSHVFGHFGIKLERSSADQATKGEIIRSKDDLQPGDLVFFSSGGRVFHVGIVLEKTGAESFNFIHASTSAGVTVTSSESSYWRPKYHSARRMF